MAKKDSLIGSATAILNMVEKASRISDRNRRAKRDFRRERREARRLEIQEERLSLARDKQNEKINKKIEEKGF